MCIPRAARKHKAAHLGFLFGSNSRQPKIGEGAEQAIAVGRVEAVGLGTEFG